MRNVHQVADRLGLARQAEYVAGYFVDHLLKIAFLSFLDVDWSQSKAYSFGRHLGSIYINVKGREPQGIIEPGAEYEAVRDEIERLAYEFRDPRTGRKLIGEVLRREEIYSGPYVEQAPDLILRPKEPSDIFFGLADFGHRETVSTVYRYTGMHRDDGMLDHERARHPPRRRDHWSCHPGHRADRAAYHGPPGSVRYGWTDT